MTNKGAMRQFVDTIMAVSRASGLTPEQVADVFDAQAKVCGADSDSGEKPSSIFALPKRLQ